MNQSLFHRRARRQLLAGIPALLLVLPASALAQAASLAEGRTTIVNDQRSDDAAIQGVIVTPPWIVSVGSLVDAEARVTRNTVAATAQVNDSTNVLSTDAGADMVWPAGIDIQGDGVVAQGAAISVGRQSLRRSSALAEALRSGFSLTIGEASGSQARLEDNLQSASAGGNDHVASLSDKVGSGAGVVAVQRGDAASSVRSSLGGVAVLGFDEAVGSSFRLGGNLQQASASGNGADLTLDVDAPALIAGDSGEATLVASGRDSEVYAGSAAVTHQIWSGSAGARIGSADAPAGYLTAGGSLTASSVTADSNQLSASAIANRSATEHRARASVVDGSDTVATSLTVQDLAGTVIAHITGGTVSQFRGPVDFSTIFASTNDAVARAAGNVSTTALSGDARQFTGSSETGAHRPGTARTGNDETSRTDGSYTVHTQQHAGATAISALANSATEIRFDGVVNGTRVTASGNRQTADAVANDARSMLDLAADRASAASSLVQSNDADVGSTVGSEADSAGVTIAPPGILQDSRLEIRDNRLEAQSVGNRGTNAMAFSGTDLAGDGSGSRGGPIVDGFGASASAALSSSQKTGQPGVAPAIVSQIAGRFSVTGDGATIGTEIDITGNRQQAMSTANSVDNSLSLAAARLDGAGGALVSSQYGQATVQAFSATQIVSRGALESSSARIADNRNVASAAMNVATNALDAEAPQARYTGPARLSADPIGGADAEGGNILVNAQFAQGSVLAGATTVLAGSSGSPELEADGPVGSTFNVSSNLTAAQASGNQVLNNAAFGRDSGGIANSQTNGASITASAKLTSFLGVQQPDRTILNSTLSVSDNRSSALARGNAAENHVTFTDRAGTLARTSGEVDRFSAIVRAPIGLVSNQSNYGAVTASVEGPIADLPLNHDGVPVEASAIEIAGNGLSATAYGNGVTNSMIPSFASASGVALVSSQTNYGPVTAGAIAGTVSVAPGDIRWSTLGITNNSVTASATGNLATNIVGIPR